MSRLRTLLRPVLVHLPGHRSPSTLLLRPQRQFSVYQTCPQIGWATMTSSSSDLLSSVPTHLRSDVRLSAVYAAMNSIAPLAMADTSWDNVGMQIQAPEPDRNRGQSVLLCNDLTQSVADEALANGDVAVVVTYHPIIFRGLKSLTLDNTQQRTLLRLAAANVSVYASHTSIDACAGGNADWLANVVSDRQAQLHEPIEPLKQTFAEQPTAGMGRLVELDAPVSTQTIVDRVKRATGLAHVIVGVPDGVDVSQESITRVAVAAGSAGSIVSKAKSAQVWVTGELSHHEALAAVEKGVIVILTLHGNSERAYLQQVLQPRLQKELSRIGHELNVVVSRADREPLQVM